MSELRQKCIEVLKESSVCQERQDKFCKFLGEAECRARHARWVYPLIYLTLGVVAWVGIVLFGDIQTDAWRRYFAAVVVLMSALAAFWRPNVSISQVDCERYLGKKLAGVDLSDLKSLLSLEENQHDKLLKLIGAAGSFISIYLTLE